jgi:HK97 family phage prohead protease
MTHETRAYSLLEVKALDGDAREIRGMATSPTTDRMGDVVEPLGVKFTNPLVLLHQHDHRSPIGHVTFDKPTKNGITFTAKLAHVTEPGALKDRIDLAWQEVKAGLVRAVSIGFRAMEYAFIEGGGIRFLETEVYELSLVTIPANADATITGVKSISAEQMAASGRSVPAASGTPTRVVKLTPRVVSTPYVIQQIKR